MLPQVVFGDLLPDPDVTAGAGPPPAFCAATGQTQLAAPGQACLVAKAAKRRRKEKHSKLGTASSILQGTSLNFAP